MQALIGHIINFRLYPVGMYPKVIGQLIDI